MTARYALVAAAVAMGAIEIGAVFVETIAAAVLAAAFLLLAAWFWFRESVWPVALLTVLFVLEVVYLSTYDWGDTSDRVMIIVTVAVAAIGVVAALVWLVQWWRSRGKPPQTAR